MTEKYFERMPQKLRIQHIILIIAFTLLMISGGLLLYNDSWLANILISSEFLFTIRGIIHRVSALLLIGLCLFHAWYVIFTKEGREFFTEMLPNWDDVINFFQLLKYYLGFSKNKPQYGRFNFIEKFEYGAVAWGSAIMILTGFILWFEGISLIIFPKWILDISLIMHSFEAILAFLTIIIWHMYNVHLNPDVFPMSRVWLDGKMSEEELKKKHPAYYDKIRKNE